MQTCPRPLGAAPASLRVPHPRRMRWATAPDPLPGRCSPPRPVGCSGRRALRRPPLRRVPGTGRSFEAAARGRRAARCCPRWRPAGLHLKGPRRGPDPCGPLAAGSGCAARWVTGSFHAQGAGLGVTRGTCVQAAPDLSYQPPPPRHLLQGSWRPGQPWRRTKPRLALRERSRNSRLGSAQAGADGPLPALLASVLQCWKCQTLPR